MGLRQSIRELWDIAKLGVMGRLPESYNLWPQAMRIADRAINLANQRNDKSTPLIVLIGEYHTEPAHIIIQMMVIELLRGSGLRLSIGLEKNYNQFQQYARKYSSNLKNLFSLCEKHRLSLRVEDKQTNNGLKVMIAKMHMYGAPRSHQLLLCYLYHSGLPVYPVDVPIKEDLTIDLEDYKVAQLKRSWSLQQLGVFSNHAVNFRNRFMINLTLEKMMLDQPDIFIQFCGAYHVFGWKEKGSSYKQSLAGMWHRLGYSVLGVPLLDDQSDLSLPKDYKHRDDYALLDVVLPSFLISHNPKTYKPNSQHDNRETAFIDATMVKSGLADGLSNDWRAFCEETKDQCKQELNTVFQDLSELYRALIESRKAANELKSALSVPLALAPSA